MKRIALISTGGTIEKTYDELQGVLANHVSNLDIMLSKLRLNGVELVRVPLMNKDSLDMTPDDHTLIAEMVSGMTKVHDGVIIVHGTDNLARSGDRICELVPDPPVPVVMTGAMRPYQLRTTDALQNITEALLAVQILSPGVWLAMHNRIMQLPAVVKDRRRGTFLTKDEFDRLGPT